MENKSSLNILNWLLVIFISLVLILSFLILKDKSTDKNNTEPNYSVDFNITQLPGFMPNQKDNSLLRVGIFTPLGMVEDEEAERKSGVYKVFKPDGSKKVHPDSFITVNFCKKRDPDSNLGSFLIEFAKNLKNMFPGCQMEIGLLRLQKDAVKKFDYMGIPYQAILFLIDKEPKNPVYTSAIFSFETSGGYWSIIWGGPRKILKRRGLERDIFLSIIKYLTIEIIRGDTLEVHM